MTIKENVIIFKLLQVSSNINFPPIRAVLWCHKSNLMLAVPLQLLLGFSRVFIMLLCVYMQAMGEFKLPGPFNQQIHHKLSVKSVFLVMIPTTTNVYQSILVRLWVATLDSAIVLL